MKTRILIIVMLAVLGWSTNVNAQTPTWQWARDARAYHNTGGGESYNMASDTFGNVYVTGFYVDTLIFGTDTLTSPGGIYLVKYNSAGNVVWAKSSISLSTGYTMPWGISIDAAGNIFIAGMFEPSSIIFDSFTLSNSGNSGTGDIFLVKYDSSGTVLWANGIGNTGGEWARGVTTDELGNCYITGIFSSPTLAFGTHTINNIGTNNIFIAKYDPMGNALWAKSAGGNNQDYGYSITVDAFGKVYVTGYFQSSIVHFDTDSIVRTSTIPMQFFLAKYDSSGNIVWVKQASGTGSSLGNRVVTDHQGNIFVTGGLLGQGSSIFSPDTISSGGAVFIVKYDSSGTVLWAQNTLVGGTQGYCIITDVSGNAYVSGDIGSTVTTITFDTITLHVSSPIEPSFIFKINPSGHALYGFAFRGGGDDWVDVALGLSGDIYFAGDFFQVDPFIIGNDSLHLTGNGEIPFIAKLGFNNLETKVIEIKPQQTILLSPNPFTTQAILTLQGTYHNPSLFIYNLLGQEVKSIPVGTKTRLTINRERLPSGMYFYKLIEDNKEVIGIGKLLISEQ